MEIFMTVESTVNKAGPYSGNGVTDSFSFSFTIYVSTDLVVTFTDTDGSETTLTEGAGATNYSVTVASYPGGGSITYPASAGTKLTSAQTITIKRVIPLTQTTDLENQGGYFPEVQELQFDRGIVIAQQQQEEINRALKIPVSDDSGAALDIPTPSANRVIGIWNAGATAIVEGPTASEISGASGNATAAAASAVAAATSETNAATSETNAASSASAASTSETNAGTSATNAATSETNAGTSATNSASSASAASTSETNAGTSATNAGTSETNAGNSASAASTSETNAGTSETNAAASASAASTSETNAATSETNATATVAELTEVHSTPINDVTPNGYFVHWTVRPATGSLQSPGAGVGFTTGSLFDGWYGGPGPASQYTASRDVDEVAQGTYTAKFAWDAAVAAGEPQHDVVGEITTGWWRFTFMESIGHFEPGYIAGKTLSLDFDVKASGAIKFIPIAWMSMGIPGRVASTAYLVGDEARADFGGGEFGGNRVYTCTTSGTSSGGAGPTGTGAAIADGSVVWRYDGEDKGREYELFEAGPDGQTLQIAWGDPHANSVVDLTTSWQSVAHDIYIPDLSEGTGTRYSGQTNDSGSRTFGEPRGGGSYFGMGFDLYHNAATGPTIYIRRLRGYIGTPPAGERVKLPRELEYLMSNGFAQMTALHGLGKATEAQMEAATATNVVVTPENIKYAKGVAKFWLRWDTSGTTIDGSHNVTSVTNTAVGKETVNIATDMSGGIYAVSGMANTANSGDATESRQVSTGTFAAGSIDVFISRGANPEVYADATICTLIGHGDH